MKTILLVSGGLDSFLAYSKLKKENKPVKAVFVNYGQKYSEKEFIACKKLYGNDLTTITINYPCIELENPQNYIPVRNLFLATTAVMYFYADQIIIAGMKDDRCSDKDEEAFENFSKVISLYSKKNIEVTSPFWNTTKGEAIGEYLKNGGNVSDLLDCISCYDGNVEKHCNNCSACFRRYISLASNGVELEKPSQNLINFYLENLSQYNPDRQERIKKILL